MIGLVDSSGERKERVRFAPYGESVSYDWTLRADVTGDGAVTSADNSALLSAWGTSNPLYDLDADGEVGSGDLAILFSEWGQSRLPYEAGALSRYDNIVGYSGYLFDASAGLYAVRFRWYDPAEGRWVTRDPAGYVDGGSLYEYARSGAMSMLDAFGLSACGSTEKSNSRNSCYNGGLAPGETRRDPADYDSAYACAERAWQRKCQRDSNNLNKKSDCEFAANHLYEMADKLRRIYENAEHELTKYMYNPTTSTDLLKDTGINFGIEQGLKLINWYYPKTPGHALKRLTIFYLAWEAKIAISKWIHDIGYLHEHWHDVQQIIDTGAEHDAIRSLADAVAKSCAGNYSADKKMSREQYDKNIDNCRGM